MPSAVGLTDSGWWARQQGAVIAGLVGVVEADVGHCTEFVEVEGVVGGLEVAAVVVVAAADTAAGLN